MRITICSARPDTHSHKCGECGHVWTHTRPIRTEDFANWDAFREHTCPACKRCQEYVRYCGEDEQAKRDLDLRMLTKIMEDLH